MNKDTGNPGETCTICQRKTAPGSEVCGCGARRKRWLNPREALFWNLTIAAAIISGVMLIESRPVLSIGVVAVPICLHFLRIRSSDYTWRKR